MKNESVTIRSSIDSQVMKRALIKGTLWGGLGGLLLLIGGIFLPLQEMKIWGALLFIFSFGLITYGLLPYKRLRRLEENPDQLTMEDNWLHFLVRGKLLFSIPVESIDHLEWIDSNGRDSNGNVYGIKVFLKNPLSKKVIIQSPKFDFAKFRQDSLKKYQSDLFFPYFSKRSFLSLNNF